MAYFRRRQQQRLAAMVMACWLFALLVSVAHACGFDASPSEMTHAEAMTVSGHGDADESTPSGCQQFCALGNRRRAPSSANRVVSHVC
jgi:hypothetical protein